MAIVVLGVAAIWCGAWAPGASAAPKSVSGWIGSDLVGPPQSGTGGQFGPFGPWAAAVNVGGTGGVGAGDVYVPDSGNNRIQQFTGDGAFVRTWGLDVIANATPAPPNSNGTGFEVCDVTAGNVAADCKPGETTDGAGNAPGGGLNSPQGVAVDPVTGDVLVSDGSGQRVQRFTATGEFVSVWGKDVIVNVPGVPNDNGTGFEVCDTTALVPNSASECKAGEFGSLAGEFFSPREVAVAPATAPNAGNVVVADQNNRRVQEFTAGGEFVRMWGRDVIVDAVPAPSNSNGTDFEVCDVAHPVTPNATGDCQRGAIAGSGEAGFSAAAPTSVAVDAAGDIYAVEVFTGLRAQKFSPVAAPAADAPTVTQEFFAPALLDGTSSNDNPVGVAVGPGGNVFVAKGGFDAPGGTCGGSPSLCERRVLELDSSGALVEEHMVGSGINCVQGVGANPDTGLIYVSSPNFGSDTCTSSATEAHRVYVLDVVAPPTAQMDPTDPVVDVAPYRATFQGLVDANGSRTGFRFEYKLSSDPDVPGSWSSVPSGGDAQAGSGDDPVAVARSVTGLSPATAYDVRLVASKPLTTLSDTTAPVSFTTLDAPPTIFGVDAIPAAASVRLAGRVVPNGSLTEYRFEYGPAGPCSANPCTQVPVPDGPDDPTGPDAEDGDVGDGTTAVKVDEDVEGLQPLTSYHYRLVAENVAAGESSSPDRTFTTGEPPTPAGRGYELVTPFDTAGADTHSAGVGLDRRDQDTWLYNATPDGERLSFTSLPNLPGSDPPRAEPPPVYRAQRRADLGRWTWEQMSPPGSLVDVGLGDGAAEDLSRFYFTAGEGIVGTLPTPPPQDPGPEFDAYVREPDGSWDWVARNTLLPLQVPRTYGTSVVGLSPDGRTAVFNSDKPLEPEANGVANALYTPHPDGTRAEVVSIVDDATRPAPGTVVDGSRPLVSEDGQRVLFRAGAANRLWVRLRAEGRTVEVTAPTDGGSRSGPNHDTSAALAMSRDGAVVFFETAQPLTGDDLDAEVDLFRFDVDAESLERISVPSSLAPGDGQGQGSACEPVSYFEPGEELSGCDVIGVVASPDGSTVYFVSPELLDVGAQRGEPNLFVHRDGETRLVGTLAGGTGDTSDVGPEDKPVDEPERPTLRKTEFQNARPVRVTPDGGMLVFRSHAQLTGFPNGDVAELYVFDAGSGAIRCASCATLGDNRPAALETQVDLLLSKLLLGLAPGRNVTADGSRVYFDTEERLVARDVNGTRDVYEYDVAADRVRLMSTGQSRHDSYYYDNSVDGQDVFFITRERLVARDLNGSARRIYDAREGGGFPLPEGSPPCSDDCRGGPAPAPGFGAPTSADGGGAGNVAPPVRPRRLAVARPGRRALRRAARTGRLPVVVRASRPGVVRIRAVARLGRRVRRVAAVRTRLRSAGRARVVLRLSRPARRVLRRRGRLRVRMVVGGRGAKPRRVGFVLRSGRARNGRARR